MPDVTEPGDRDEQIAELQADVAALDSRLGRAEQDAAAARFLAGGADRDGAETRAKLREFREEVRTEFADVRQEMRIEFADVRREMRTFRDQNNRVLSAMRADMTDGFAQADRNFLAVRGQLDAVVAFMQLVAERMPDGNGDDRPSG